MLGLVPDRNNLIVAVGAVPEGWDEDKLAYIEYLTINAKLVTCEQIRGNSLYLHATAWDVYGDEQFRAGSAYCNTFFGQYIEAALNYPAVIAHELHHIAQGCDAPLPVDTDADADHADWHRSGAFEAIEKIRLEILARYTPPDGGV